MDIETYEKLEEIVYHIDEKLEYENNDALEVIRTKLSEVLFEHRKVKFKQTFYAPTHLAYMNPGTLPCPVCASTPDFCQNHKHYLCKICGEDLEFQTKNDVWMCEYCDSCEHCGAPPDKNFCVHCQENTKDGDKQSCVNGNSIQPDKTH